MKPVVHLHIGQYFASKEPAIIQTVLGSCVSVCFYDPVTRIGGMNHILYSGEVRSSYDYNARYGINAMELLINEMVGLGAVRSRLIAKVFGGGNMFNFDQKNQQGIKNTDFVVRFLELDGIKLVAQDTGGRFSRKILFHTDTGKASVKRTNANINVNKKGKGFIDTTKKVKTIPKKTGDVTIF
ncbi:MAG: chemotaxis protein CheD [Deltaproteobacteria bacterium]|nr:chemotaxis protein CheD [Deltaproteobacteria bacterium]